MSPKGVNYYESDSAYCSTERGNCFRPQQGLTIMNSSTEMIERFLFCFRPQQGLTIMNSYKRTKERLKGISFRPQQGLTIMNKEVYILNITQYSVSVPNRG